MAQITAIQWTGSNRKDVDAFLLANALNETVAVVTVEATIKANQAAINLVRNNVGAVIPARVEPLKLTGTPVTGTPVTFAVGDWILNTAGTVTKVADNSGKPTGYTALPNAFTAD